MTTIKLRSRIEGTHIVCGVFIGEPGGMKLSGELRFRLPEDFDAWRSLFSACCVAGPRVGFRDVVLEGNGDVLNEVIDRYDGLPSEPAPRPPLDPDPASHPGRRPPSAAGTGGAR